MQLHDIIDDTLVAWQPECLRSCSYPMQHHWQGLHHCVHATDLINKCNLKVKKAKHVTVLQQHKAALLNMHMQQPTMSPGLSPLFRN